jgi:hypothetical protein
MGYVWLWIGVGFFGVVSVVSFTANRSSSDPAVNTRNKERGWCCQKEFE